ncbi:MAG: SCO family protein [Rhodospirillales bacterium]|nr:SCO family protein [Rhodospirillales bacterium]
MTTQIRRTNSWRRSARAAPLVALLAAVALPAAGDSFDDMAAFKYSQAAIGRTVGDHGFRDRAGRAVTLAEMRGKPLVVNLVYTSCSDTCPLIAQSLVHGVELAQASVGRDAFRVVTIGFDARVDSPERMRIFARQQGIRLPNWDFLSTDAATADRLSEELGFIFFASAKGFDHLAQVTILDADGKVYRHVYGAEFEPQQLVEPLKDLIFGRFSALASWEGVVGRVKLYCTVYDPSVGRYRFDYRVPIIIGVGALTLFAIGFFVVRAWLRYFRPPARRNASVGDRRSAA